MVTPISACLFGDGTGRDGYIIRDPSFTHGALKTREEATPWHINLRNHTQGHSSVERTAPKASVDPDIGPFVDLENFRSGHAALRAELRAPRKSWVPKGGAPRATMAPGTPDETPRRKKDDGAAVPVWVELTRAMWGLQTPRRHYIDRDRQRAAALWEASLCGTPPTAKRPVSCRAPESATAARASARAAATKVQKGRAASEAPERARARPPAPRRAWGG
mmetsp:Transcript_136793/g.381318  ORF Transcript_136793/g.381318 Transcript_136793/m.381318 type:complete len:220 (+) Transcript_136793:158-817(+)|eukprot:CAMPEP_0179148122 /NCGR_PEP_ID=MMETSP0796-20121207/71656_1 /TAXON_ID=73915 /ORGANISM="Pyrodinium bahamense, Strain pbaha01" /LENGTH=219 /DNA_ID=CAMNT_0020848801 /DNA_START=296 /DNA_END=955 /DNA_ORIENTATION=+